jgi:predicted RNA-binding protein with PIN domain
VASELFDPLLELALDVARQGSKAKPPVPAPPRLAPMLKFTKVPGKAKDAVFDVLDSDEKFRARVLEKAEEKSVGRIGMSFLARPDGWQDFVATMVDAADEPLIESSRTLSKLEAQLDAAHQARDRAGDDLAESETANAAATAEGEALRRERDELELEVRRLQTSNAELVEQRRRAVAELKQTEAVMVRHVQERKRLESQVEAMAAAQLATTAVGGGVTDVEVRASVDALDDAIDELRGHVDHLRRQATPERVQTRRRTPLPVPPGIFDDSSEMTDYLFAIPNMVALVDGYNVTKETHDEWELEQQRDWLEQGLRALASRTNTTFDVVFDGANVVTSGARDTSSGVRIRFSPEGVEADDVIIAEVGTIDRSRPVTVVSSDKRVRSGARDHGANLLTSRQLLDALG